MPSPNENAADLGGTRGESERHNGSGQMPRHRKAYPAPLLEVLALSALCWDTGRTRLRELGIGPEAFEDDAGRIAAALVNERDFSADELRLLWREDAETLALGEAIEMFPLDPTWARDIIDKFAQSRGAQWLPEVLRWGADRLEHDGWSVARIAPELFNMLRLAGGGRAA